MKTEDFSIQSHTTSEPVLSSAEVIDNPWRKLRRFTDARIGLGRTGVSLPTHEMLGFQLAHAQAKDAVHLPLDVSQLHSKLHALQTFNGTPPFLLQSRALDRFTYLQRPDMGRRLEAASKNQLVTYSESGKKEYDLAIAVVDGLSSKAVQQNVEPFMKTFLKNLAEDPALNDLKLAPFSIVQQGRVAIGDEIGELLKAEMVVVLIGERPGLSSPDSLGLYLTWHPKVGRHDAERNCISNIRPAGLSYEEASRKALYLIRESRRLKLSGVNLKDRSHEKTISRDNNEKNFLIE